MRTSSERSGQDRRFHPFRQRRRRPLVLAGLTALAAIGALMPSAAQAAQAAPAPSSAVPVPVFSPTLNEVGQVNLSAVAAASHADRAARGTASTSTNGYRSVDNTVVTRRTHGQPSLRPAGPTTTLTTTNVRGEYGFTGLTGLQQASTSGGVDLEPPDQALCAGANYVMEFVNNALSIYSPSGTELLSPIGSPSVFLQPTTSFFSDPRCYFDRSTQRWFILEFIVGTTNASGQEVTPSLQFEAVSDTADPTGNYHVYSFDTTDTTTAGCPCFGDYDELGVDANGIYITTDEFGISTSAYNGVIIYAISKAELETYPVTGLAPTIFGYRVQSDPFGSPYIVAPTSTPAGARYAPDTEYFVESNGNAQGDDHLVVYALHDTSLLAAPSAPSLYRTEVTTEAYSTPSDAAQKPGPRPLGAEYQAPAGRLQADFDAEMEPTYVGGNVYAELDTGTAAGTDGVDWFILHPELKGSTLSATVSHQGLVSVPGTSLLYPYTALDQSGVGYLLFSLSGTSNYPSPGYISYGRNGPTGPAIVAYGGAAPEDGFTCYAAFVGPNYGGCRWGDYSMGVAMGGRIYMSTEMIPPTQRDELTNWGTYVWSAPPPAS